LFYDLGAENLAFSGDKVPAVRYIPDLEKLRQQSLVFLNREMPLPSGLK